MTRLALATVALVVCCAVFGSARADDCKCNDAKRVDPADPVKPLVKYKRAKCRFVFCDERKWYVVGKRSDKAFTGRICHKHGKTIGTIDRSGEAYLLSAKRGQHGQHTKLYKHPLPISLYAPKHLKQRFSPSFFKAYTVGHRHKYSGVGHEHPQQNQAKYLHNKCWALPVHAYQVLDKKGHVKTEVHSEGNELKDCVEFCTKLY